MGIQMTTRLKKGTPGSGAWYPGEKVTVGTMQITFIGASRRHGKSGKTGNNYDICELHHAWPMDSKRTDAYTFEAHGCTERKLELSPDALGQFAKCKVGQVLNVSMEPNPRNPERNICTGIASE